MIFQASLGLVRWLRDPDNGRLLVDWGLMLVFASLAVAFLVALYGMGG